METNVIKNERQYREYLNMIDELISIDPDPDTPEGKSLELLSVLIESYESKRFNISIPNPIDAILFRMEEEGLRQKDLIPIIGSKSKVSEILSGKRPLTLKMVRALNSQLKIPAEVLITEVEENDEDASIITDSNYDWSSYPYKIMQKRGWLSNYLENNDFADAIKIFFSEAGGMKVGAAYFRRTMHLGGEVSNNQYSLNAWLARIILKSREIIVTGNDYTKADPEEFMKELAKLSWLDQGPLIARDFLFKSGIKLVFETHLPGTHLDGATTCDIDNSPIIGMTLRYDRLDNFWFTLMHEVAHLLYHVKGNQEAYLDNLDNLNPDDEAKEIEANTYAQEAFIHRNIWHRSDAYRLQTADSVLNLSKELRISPAIIAGRIRKETGNYRKLTKLVGHKKVTKLFANELE